MPSLAHDVDRRVLGLSLVALLTFAIGYFGQGTWGVGVTSPSAVGAIVTDVVGGAGSRKPVRVQISIAVTNNGKESIRVLSPDSSGGGADVVALTPPDLIVKPGAIGRLDADIALRCDLPEPPLLPPFQAELPDGLRRGFHVGGSEKLLEACGRAAPAVRPLLASVPKPSAGPTSSTTATEDGSLVVRLTSPIGRRSEVRAIRAGGADLRMSPAAVTVAGKDPAVVRLTAPTSCAKQWQIAGIPSALEVDLVSTPGTSSAVRTTVQVRLGPVLTGWLLATSCPEPR